MLIWSQVNKCRDEQQDTTKSIKIKAAVGEMTAIIS